MSGSMTELTPKFKFGATLWNVVKIVFIFVCVLALLCVVRIALRRLGFTVSFERVFVSFAQIAAAAVWPCFILIGIYLFKDNLDGVVKAVHTALYGGDMKPSLNPQEDDDREEASGRQGKEDGKVVGKSLGSGLSEESRMAMAFERYALNRVQKDEGVLVARNVSIFNSRINFDGAFEKNNVVYGIEVRASRRVISLQSYLLRVEEFYRSLSKSQQNRFRLLVCIRDYGGNKHFPHVRSVTVPVEYRYYPFDYNEEQKENKL